MSLQKFLSSYWTDTPQTRRNHFIGFLVHVISRLYSGQTKLLTESDLRNSLAGLKMSRENGISLSEASKLNKRTLAPTFDYSGRHCKSDKERNYKLQTWNTWDDRNCCLLNHFCGFKACPFATNLNGNRIMPKLELWPPGNKTRSINKSGALTGQSRWFLLSDYMNDIKIALI